MILDDNFNKQDDRTLEFNMKSICGPHLVVTEVVCSQEAASHPFLPWIILLYFALPELGIRVLMAKPFLWQLVAVDPIWNFSPFRALGALYPVLIRGLSEDMQRRV